jgi:xanthine/uracil permease
MLLAPFLSKLRKVFTPLVSGVVVLLIGCSLIPTAFYGLATPVRDGAPPWLGLAVGSVVIAVLVAAQATRRPWIRISGVALSIAAGCAACGLLGGLHSPPVGTGEWLTHVRVLPHGFAINLGLMLPFAFIYLVSSLEAMGDMTATSQLSGLSPSGDEHWRRLSGGLLADGLTSTVSALFGDFRAPPMPRTMA